MTRILDTIARVAATVLAAAVVAPAPLFADAVSEYEAYLADNRCDPKPDNCLEGVSYTAQRSDGRFVRITGVFRWRLVAQQKNAEVLPHLLLPFMRKLRDAYGESPDVYGEQLYNQIDYLVANAVGRNGALVWENRDFYAQAMEQVEYAHFFASAAQAYALKGDRRTARGLMRHALMFSRSLDMPYGPQTGGVRSQFTYCGAKRARFHPCYWFHSRGVGIAHSDQHSVLNQHLHAVRDILNLYFVLQHNPDLMPDGFGGLTRALERLETHAIAGLYQLIFANGAIKAQPRRGASIDQFRWYRHNVTVASGSNPISYTWAHYAYDIAGRRPVDIAHGSVCHYHTHSLTLIASIATTLEERRALHVETAEGWRLYEAMDALLTPVAPRGGPGAAYEFYRAEDSPAIKIRRQGCPCGPWQERGANGTCAAPRAEIAQFYHRLYE